jgi:hypothetical protein
MMFIFCAMNSVFTRIINILEYTYPKTLQKIFSGFSKREGCFVQVLSFGSCTEEVREVPDSRIADKLT